MFSNQPAVTRSRESILATNKVLRNTYTLLSLTLIFSAVMAAVSLTMQVGYAASLGSFVGAIVLIWFVLPRTANSGMGIFVVFGFTGLLGFGLGPMLNHYLAMQNGSEIIGTALGGTGIIFLALSGYVLTTKKDFSFLSGFLMVGFFVIFGAILVNLFLDIPGLSLAISSAVILIMSGFILYDTSRIINGGETNYLLATTSLYLSIYNIFIHLLSLLGVMSND